MQKIKRYILPLDQPNFGLDIPLGSKILSIGSDSSPGELAEGILTAFIYVRINPEADYADRRFFIAKEEQNLPDLENGRHYKFIGSITIMRQHFHLFEIYARL